MKKYAVLVNSCDAYSDLWEPFFYLFKRNWEGCEKLNIYINTETITEFKCDLSVKTINTKLDGCDMWGKRLLHCVDQISEEYLVVLMDDFYLRNPIDTQVLDKAVEALEKNPDIAVFYLTRVVKCTDDELQYGRFSEIKKKTNYRLNSAPALWRKEKLKRYTKESDNPWVWEYFGTCRTNKTEDRFFCVANDCDSVYDYAHAIYRGRWLEKDVFPLIAKYQLNIDTSPRGTVKEKDVVPKRSLIWKLNFLKTGIDMVGLEALMEVYRDIKNVKNAHKR